MTPTVDGRRAAPRRAAEAILLALACFAPWAFGSVDAWAELVLYAGIAAVTLLVAIADGGAARGARLLCLPGLALGALALLAVVQATPLPEGVLKLVSPSSAALRRDLLPRTPEVVAGDPGPPVPLPAPRLSQDPDATLQAGARLAAAWLLFQGVLGAGGGWPALRRLAVAFAANATLLAVFSIAQALTWNGRIFWIRPSPAAGGWSSGGPFVSHTHLAEALNLGLGPALGLLLGGGWRELIRGRGSRLWAGYAAAMIALAVVASNSRGGFLAMLGAGSLLLLTLRARPLRVAAGLAVAAAVLGAFLLALGDASPYLGRIATIVDPADDGYAVRRESWTAGLGAWRDHPLWGTGLGTYPTATARYVARDRGVFFGHAENEYVEWLAEGGLVACGLWVAAAAGLVRLARRAAAAAASPGDRALVLGTASGLAALALNGLSDFGPHIPGVGVPAVILAATLARVGLGGAAEAGPGRGGFGWRGAGLAAVALAALLVARGVADARVEARLVAAGLPVPGEVSPGLKDVQGTRAEMERRRDALAGVLALRPGWGDGHLRLGLAHLALYQAQAADWVREAGPRPEDAEVLASPAWLLGVAHAAARRGEGGGVAAAMLAHEPIRRHLVPAARCFLEARRCGPVAAVPHYGLGSLAFLLEPGGEGGASAYLARAARLAGGDASLLDATAQAALQVDDSALAARCWRRSLQARPAGWEAVADAASAALPPDRLLAEVVPGGALALRFAGRLFSGDDPADRAARDRFLRAAASRLPAEGDLPPPERLRLEAEAWAALDDPARALGRMEEALALAPDQLPWRKELIGWLVRWRRFDDAHAQARLALLLAPGDAGARALLDSTAEALAREGGGEGGGPAP